MHSKSAALAGLLPSSSASSRPTTAVGRVRSIRRSGASDCQHGKCSGWLVGAADLATVAASHVLGGPTYDALIAFTAAEHRATLMSLDQRAAATYEALGVTVEQLAP